MARKRDEPDLPYPPETGWGEPVAGTPTIAGADQSAAELPVADVLRDKRVKGQPGRARVSVILLASLVVQLIVVGAAGNPGVVGSATRYANKHQTLLGDFLSLPRLFSWRVQQPTVDPGNLLVSEWFGLLALVVVAGLLSAAVVRGPITFWRAGVGVWMAVIVGTLANGMVRRGIVNDLGRYDQLGGKAAGVLFFGTGGEVIAGVITGLLAGLAAAIVAVLTRRPEAVVVPPEVIEPAPYAEPAAPPPWHGDEPAAATTSALSYGSPYSSSYGASGDAATTSFPAQRDTPRDDWQDAQVTRAFSAGTAGTADTAAGHEPEHTREHTPAHGAEPDSAPEPTPEQEPQPERTQALPVSDFPRPPDDEELGHHPSEDEERPPRQ